MKTIIHVGCGPIYMESDRNYRWINMDINPAFKADITGDCRQLSVLIGNNVGDYLWSCHHLEHLPYPDGVQETLRQFLAVLKPGGIARIATPDLETVAQAYCDGSSLKFIYGEDFKGYAHIDCPAERFLFFMRAWEHTFIPDFVLLSTLMREAGFENVRRCTANQSAIPGWCHDRFQSESLYIEGQKPAQTECI
jgi:predicted SAM-dependent methyltransferase